MDVIRSENVKVPNAVLVSGLSHSEADEYIFELLGMYGHIGRVLKMESQNPLFQNTAIVEYESGAATESLKHELPCSKISPSDSSVQHHIQLLSTLFTSSLGSSLTSSYIAELETVAKLGGIDFESVLQAELARIRGSTSSGSPHVVPQVNPQHCNITDVPMQQENDVIPNPHLESNIRSPLSLPSVTTDALSPSAATQMPLHPRNTTASPSAAIHLSADQLNPPEIQRLVVEHIVKGSETSPQHHRALKLRSFSGKSPVPHMEADYETWRSHIDFYLKDPTFSDALVVRKIVESLLTPAAAVVKHLGPLASSTLYLSLLDSAYAAVGDADELFAQFLHTNQNAGEKPSAYLQRLQVALSAVVNRGGLDASQMDRQLLKQFCRGCWNNSLIANLQLEQKTSCPPRLSELLLLLRTEEEKQAAKSNRMKQHLGFPKTKAHSHLHAVFDPFASEPDMLLQHPSDPDTETQRIKRQIADLQSQLADLKVSHAHDHGVAKAKIKPKKPKDSTPQTPHKAAGKPSKRPRPWYCFSCGDDGHISPACENDPNPALVEAKQKELRQKQRAWDEVNADSTDPRLN